MVKAIADHVPLAKHCTVILTWLSGLFKYASSQVNKCAFQKGSSCTGLMTLAQLHTDFDILHWDIDIAYFSSLNFSQLSNRKVPMQIWGQCSCNVASSILKCTNACCPKYGKRNSYHFWLLQNPTLTLGAALTQIPIYNNDKILIHGNYATCTTILYVPPMVWSKCFA